MPETLSNGQPERFVDTFKRALWKTKGEGVTEETLKGFLLNYKSSPNSSVPGNITPAESLMGHCIKIALDFLRPARKTNKRREEMENQFNRHHGAYKRIFSVKGLVYARTYNSHINW
uniref:Integrase_SAM-like_N domain-containing protein n=1 Tax=Heterorhabditis bacteriophora TaxID=37862 RepID=A0A1I7XM32_HETBA